MTCVCQDAEVPALLFYEKEPSRSARRHLRESDWMLRSKYGGRVVNVLEARAATEGRPYLISAIDRQSLTNAARAVGSAMASDMA